MAFTFGLLHGFGFAGALADIGLPKDQLALSLLLFNLGIEAGQILVVAAALALLWAVSRLPAVAQATGTPFQLVAEFGATGVSGLWRTAPGLLYTGLDLRDGRHGRVLDHRPHLGAAIVPLQSNARRMEASPCTLRSATF